MPNILILELDHVFTLAFSVQLVELVDIRDMFFVLLEGLLFLLLNCVVEVLDFSSKFILISSVLGSLMLN